MDKTHTLKKNYEFRRMYRQGASAVGGCMVVYCRKNRSKTRRLGVTVSTKIGKAVQRNRARRRLREVYRLHGDVLRPGYDVVLVARGRTLTASWGEMNATFERLCGKLNLLVGGETPRNNSAPRKDRPPRNGGPSRNSVGQSQNSGQSRNDRPRGNGAPSGKGGDGK